MEAAELRELFDRFGAQVLASASLMTRPGSPSAADITVAAFVGLAREARPPQDAVLGRLLRRAGRAAGPPVCARGAGPAIA